MRLICCGFALALACAGAIACSGGGDGGSTTAPTTPGGSTPGTGGGSTPSCRTLASSQRSVQTFTPTGQTVTTDSTCTFESGSNTATCTMTFNDSVGGPGTGSQVSRFSSRSDLVDEASTNPPRALSLRTETVTTVAGAPAGFSLTTTSTNSYDPQKRLTSTVIVTPTPIGQLTTTVTYSAWDASGRPTAGISNSTGGTVPVTITYDNANRTVTRNISPNICTQTHDTNGIIIRETCTGTTPSQTDVLIMGTQQICK